MRLADPDETNLDCLDWQFFLSEIDRLETQIRGYLVLVELFVCGLVTCRGLICRSKNNFLRDRSFGKRGDGHVRVQVSVE